ncbi:MAG TPA: alpha/beta fold hydrolase [Holophagaceae bacterium]|jgi:pimeloyl-ACP methyl ester carboxylesterase|nr:alpha/beta fold hydrolase [Holophagaceae bacterium]
MRPLILILSLCLPVFAQNAAQVPRIEWSDLPGEIVEKAPDLRTGYLVVPENRHAAASRSIHLPFIVEKSRNPAAPADPILFTAGGPGGSSLSGAKRRARQPLLDDRDLILFEQRGTRWAEPSLAAPEIDAALRSGWGTRLDGKPDPAVIRVALGAALKRFKDEGVDLSGYTTEESAADIADLRRLLGIQSFNLYGVSYSTKLMLTVLRDHPEGVRAVLLDSVLTPESNWDEEAPANIFEVLDRAIAAGLRDEQLREACTDLKARFLRLAARANRHPVVIRIKSPADGSPLTVRLDGVGLIDCVYAGLETAGSIRPTLLAMDAACKGDFQSLAPMLEMDLGSSQGASWGMRLAVWCNEELPFEKAARILHPAGVPKELKGFIQSAVPLEALDAWPQGNPDPKENTPVSSAAPILIISGEFDPDTPGKWARAAMTHLPNAHILVFPGMSHAPLFTHPESARIMKAFFDDPSHAPEPGKIREVPAFLLSGMAP